MRSALETQAQHHELECHRAELDDEEERKVEHQFSRQYHLITRLERLDTVAKDLVRHFMNRGFRGKGMVISIDKATAVRMYDLVQIHWKAYIEELKQRKNTITGDIERSVIDGQIKYMEETDMAVVVSSGQNEITQMEEKGLDIRPHRIRMVNEKMDEKFKDPDDPFRLVFVCAMWMTGFDVPSCSTMYMDKPMKNHTLMQTISRANRVFGEKLNGLIVDYVGIFRDLERALAIYGAGGEGGDPPIVDKDRLVEFLEMTMETAEGFLTELGISIPKIMAADTFGAIALVDQAVESILADDSTKKKYLNLAADVNRIYKAILPDARANAFIGKRSVLRAIERNIKNKSEPVDISEFMSDVETLLDASIATDGYIIGDPDDSIKDLSGIDFDALKKRFENGKKNTEVERLKSAIDRSISKMVSENRSRIDFRERFEELIAQYNSGSMNIDILFKELVDITQDLNEEDERHIREGLSQEELAIFDILTRPEMDLSEQEINQVKLVCRSLLDTLTAERLVLDWKKGQTTTAQVKVTIEEQLDTLPGNYDTELFETKCSLVYDHIYDSYSGAGQSVYEHLTE